MSPNEKIVLQTAISEPIGLGYIALRKAFALGSSGYPYVSGAINRKRQSVQAVACSRDAGEEAVRSELDL